MAEFALIVVYTSAGFLIGLEYLFPAHPNKLQAVWYLRALLINAINILVFYLVDSYMVKINIDIAVFDLSQLPPVIGAAIAYFIFTFVVYWWHRLRHSSNFFWKYFHQLHHSPTRIEALTAYYIHPLDMLANLLISNVIVFILLGLNINAASWYTIITGVAGLLIHANIRLPRQVGYVFQTPEMHRLHHKSNHHAHNYSDIVWWDMLFGTYRNPEFDIDECGFSGKKEQQLLKMLLGHDLNIEMKSELSQ